MRWIAVLIVVICQRYPALQGNRSRSGIELVDDRLRRPSARETESDKPVRRRLRRGAARSTSWRWSATASARSGPDGLVTTLAGTGRKGDGGDDGPAAQAELNGPHSLAVTANGDIFVADTWNNRVRKIDARSGRITNVAGTGRKGFSGDGGPATQAEFGGIYCLALDEAGADARPGGPR